MKEYLLKISSYLGAALTVALLSVLTMSVFYARPTPALIFDCLPNTPTTIQVFFDVGQGMREADSSRVKASIPNSWSEIRLKLPQSKIKALRLDPSSGPSKLKIKNIRIIDARGAIVKTISLSALHAEHQIQSIEIYNNQLELQTTEDANDPILSVDIQGALDLSKAMSMEQYVAQYALPFFFYAAIWCLVILLLYGGPCVLTRTAFWNGLKLRPYILIWTAAIFGTILACSPVIFMGKSLMSPGNGGVPLFYDQCPTLPSQRNCAAVNVHGADVGAMMWAQFPQSVAQERSIKKFGEFPLWNRFNSAGISMIGQGQTMLGDPLNWLAWLFGVNSLTFDIKFILLRVIFAATLGLSVSVITRATMASVIVAFSSAFLGYFLFRINHPAIFTLCYTPLIALTWLKVIYTDNRRRLRWLVGLVAANWLVLNSGTAKEAYMAIVVLNIIGMFHFVVEKARSETQFKVWIGLIVTSGVCFLMISIPIWGTLLEAIRNGTSNYSNAAAYQYPPGLFLNFVDSEFALLRFNTYVPAINAVLFSGFTIGLVYAGRAEKGEVQRSSIAFAFGCIILIALSYGIFPANWLIRIPFIRNIININYTFSTILIVPACILAGIGLDRIDRQKELRERKDIAIILGCILLGLLFFYALSFAEDGGLNLKYFEISSIMVAAGVLIGPKLMFGLIRGRLSYAKIGICLIVMLFTFGPTAMYPANNIDNIVFSPQGRIDLRSHPAIVDRLLEKITAEPTRVIGTDGVMIAGYNEALGLEHINGPDAIWNRGYRELTEALKLPYNNWGWRMVFDKQNLSTLAHALDFLGVGYIFSSYKLDDAADIIQTDNDGHVYEYFRKNVWPRAFYTNHISSYASVKTLARRITNSSEQPFVAVKAQLLKKDPSLKRLTERSTNIQNIVLRAKNYILTNNSTSFTIDAPSPGVVYLGETDEPNNFIVTVNGKPAPYFTANYAFKAVYIDSPGTYRVSFRYWPAHLTLYLAIASLGLLLWLTIFLTFWRRCAGKATPSLS